MHAFQRHRLVWVQEMKEEQIRQAGENAPTIDSIELFEFESNDAVKKWLKQKVPAFVHDPA
jgi:hypothetical protein